MVPEECPTRWVRDCFLARMTTERRPKEQTGVGQARERNGQPRGNSRYRSAVLRNPMVASEKDDKCPKPPVRDVSRLQPESLPDKRVMGRVRSPNRFVYPICSIFLSI